MKGRHLAVLAYDKGQAPEDVIKSWFFTSTPEEEARGDMACMTDTQYDACVIPGRMRSTGKLKLNIDELYPTQCAYVIMFTQRKPIRCIYVLGIVPFAMLKRLNGEIQDTDLLGPDVLKTRAFMPPRHLEENASPPPPPPPTMFPLPIHILALDTTNQARIERMCHDVNLAAIWAYRAWLMKPWSRGSIEPPHLPPSETILQAAHLEAGCSVFCALLGDYLEFTGGGDARREFRIQYECKRIDTERMLFYARMDTYTTEEALVDLLEFNNFNANYVEGTALDYQAFWELYPYADYEPTRFLCVSMDDLSVEHINVMPRYPPGGVVHLPCYAPALAKWLWVRHANAIQKRFTLVRRAQFETMLEAQPLVAEWLHDECKVLEGQVIVENVENVETTKKTKRNFKELAEVPRHAVAGDAKPQGTTRIAPEHGGYDLDIEDLWAAAPPCIAQLRAERHAPKNWQRLRGTQIMWGADVSVRSMERLYRQLNDAYPNKGESFETRFPLMSYINTPHNTTRCGNLVRNALERKVDTLHCPFAHQLAQPGMSVDQVTPLCRNKCGARGQGPHDVLRNNLRAAGTVAMF